jgi:hypothetical protein
MVPGRPPWARSRRSSHSGAYARFAPGSRHSPARPRPPGRVGCGHPKWAPSAAGIVSTLIHGDVLDWGRIMAANVLASAPPILIYAFLMDYYIAGLTAGATKG